MPVPEDVIRKHVLKNAFDFGKASAGAVVGKVIAECPDAKSDMKSTMALINGEIKAVSALSQAEIGAEMSKHSYAEKKEEEKKAIELPNAVQGKVITRFPPEPAGYLHIGHAKAAFLNFEASKAYGGRMLLRFDDTNPEKESYEYVNPIRESLEWLGIQWAAETYTSDRMPEIYRFAQQLIEKSRAYVCTCPQETMSEGRSSGKPCACRGIGWKKQLERWGDMLHNGYKEGDAVLRFKGDLESQNTVMRDPTLARIILKKHYRQNSKYRVWPGYDLGVVVMDHLEGVTHPMRSKEYELRNELYYALFDALSLKAPKLIEFSRLTIKNAPVSKRLLRPLVEAGKVDGWDDPRLPTLAALRRRGILPDAIRAFVLSFGLSKVESEPGWEVLLSENRKLLDPVSPHYFFVQGPVRLAVKGLGNRKVRLPLHPKAEKGYREIEVSETLHISCSDAKSLKKGEVFRLKDLCNAKLVKVGAALEAEYSGDGMVPKKIQWVAERHLPCDVLVPHDLLDENGEYDPESLAVLKGYCEDACARLKPGETVQFERFGFCRLDKAGERLTFIYSC